MSTLQVWAEHLPVARYILISGMWQTNADILNIQTAPTSRKVKIREILHVIH